VRAIASNKFIKFKKKTIKKLQIELDNQIKEIIKNPERGEIKKGDLQNIRVVKFKFQEQLFLLSYEIKNNTLYLYSIGSHQNYYKNLKRFLKDMQKNK
jgi:hypothetical protein